MNQHEAKKLFRKYLNNECSETEIHLLETFLESYQNKDFEKLKLGINHVQKKRIWNRIKSRTYPTQKTGKGRFRHYFKYAAMLTIAIGTLLSWYQMYNSPTDELIIPEDYIVLKMGGNRMKKVIGSNTTIEIKEKNTVIGSQSGNLITYSKHEVITELIFNEISVPNGKNFKLILSDGTFVHLNSGTTFRFPINFISGQERKVFLIGEAYFEVSKDSAHPFMVSTKEMDVAVLGTHFDINAYANGQTYTVLSEGSISITSANRINDGILIKPGEKAVAEPNVITVTKVDINDYLGWRENKLIFDNEPFIDIMDKIERKYNVAITNKYQDLNRTKFKGWFEDETIIDLLDTFKESAEFEYKIVNNEIIIFKPDD